MSETASIPLELQGVEETLLIPLWARARETRRPNGLFKDERAVAMVDAIPADYGRFRVAKTAIAVRTVLLDRAVTAFLDRHPDAMVINLGAGLDTRFFRLDNGRLTWVEVDLPRSMALRKRLIPEEPRHLYVEGSVLEPDWLAAITPTPGQPVLILAEGLFMYFREADVRTLLGRLSARFPGAELVFETFSPMMLRVARWQDLLRISASFEWGLWSGRELERWVPGLRWIEDWCFFDHFPERWGPLAGLSFVPFYRSMLRIEHVKLPG